MWGVLKAGKFLLNHGPTGFGTMNELGRTLHDLLVDNIGQTA